MAVFEIPLSPQPQTFDIQLVNTTYRLTFYWNNAPSGGWMLDVADSNDVPLISGIAVVTGANLLEQYDYIMIGGALQVQTDFDLNAVPTFQNLGVTSHIYFITPD